MLRVGNKSEKRTSKLSASVTAIPVRHSRSYNNEVRSDPVDIEDMLKAGHCVEFERGTQFCAKAIGNADGKNMRNDVDFMDPNWFTMRPDPVSLLPAR